MSGNWQRVRLLEIQAREKWALNGGPFGSKLVSSMYCPSGVPVIRGTNLSTDARFNMDDFVFVSDEKANALRANWARPGDVVFTQRGTLGQVGLIPLVTPYDRFVISQSQMKLTVDSKKALAEFVYYLFKSPLAQRRIQDVALRAGVPHINLEILRQFEIILPPLETQRRIADILSAYDDLIELNQRRIAILEEMARRLFEEWFVRFRYPGSEGDALVETPLGPAPSNWQVVKAGELFDYCGGGTPSKDEPAYWDGGTIQWYTPTDLTKGGSIFLDSSSLQISELGLAKSSARLFPPRSVMMTSRATLGVFAINAEPATTNQGFITFKSTTHTPTFYLLHCLKSEFARMEAVASGATFKEITKGALAELPFLKPPSELVARFERQVAPLMGSVRTYTRQNTRLRAARDLLLPKLISGEIDVSAAPAPDATARDAA